MIRLNLSCLKKMPLKRLAQSTCYIALLGGFYFLVLAHPYTREDSQQLNTRLNDLQAGIINLQNEVKKPAEKIDLSEINQDFNQLTALIEQLKLKDNTQFNQALNDSRAALEKRLDAIHQIILSLDQKEHPIKYLPINALPFEVVSIDSIQQVSVASVAYDYRTIPLEKNDSLAGWTVVQIDFGKQRLEFENKNKERVLVTLAITQDDQHA